MSFRLKAQCTCLPLSFRPKAQYDCPPVISTKGAVHLPPLVISTKEREARGFPFCVEKSPPADTPRRNSRNSSLNAKQNMQIPYIAVPDPVVHRISVLLQIAAYRLRQSLLLQLSDDL